MMDASQSNDRSRSAGGGTRIQRSLLLAGTALFLVGVATLLGGVGTDVVADASRDAVDAGGDPVNASTPAGDGTTSTGDDATTPTAPGDMSNDRTPSDTARGSDEPTATPSPSGDDDSLLDGILG